MTGLEIYDTQNRLTEADIPGAGRTQYGWDWVANRTTPTAVYNDADQLTSFGGSSYTYNTTGDLTAITGAGAKSFTYTNAGMLNTVTTGAATASMSWDSPGNRLSYTSCTGGTTQYAYDITAGVPAVIVEITGGNTVLYVREPNGALIARKAGTDRKYYHFDELGSTLFLTDAGAVQTDKYVYNAFGGVITRTGSTNQPYQYIGRYGYYTHWQDANMPLLQLGVRFYNPAAGVFTQRDPVLDGLNWYSYVSGGVMTAVDPSGMARIRRAIFEDSWLRHTGFVIYDHAYLHFDILPCKIKCDKPNTWSRASYRNMGYFPGSVIHNDDMYERGQFLLKDVAVDMRIEFEKALCECVNKQSNTAIGDRKKHSPWYHCGDWANAMWECASARVESPRNDHGGEWIQYLPRFH